MVAPEVRAAHRERRRSRGRARVQRSRELAGLGKRGSGRRRDVEMGADEGGRRGAAREAELYSWGRFGTTGFNSNKLGAALPGETGPGWSQTDRAVLKNPRFTSKAKRSREFYFTPL